jgi:uncharacterized membrane protein
VTTVATSTPPTPSDAVTLPSLLGVARHSMPRVFEATLVPTALLYSSVKILGSVWPGAIAALIWAVLIIFGRALRSQRVPGILVLAAIGLAIRTAVAMASESTFIYFLQPIITSMVVAAIYLGTLWTDQPMIARLARDFCPLTEEVAQHPGVRRHFRRLTVMWSGVNIVNGAISLWLLLALQSSTFIAMKTLTVAVVTWSAVAVTVLASLRVCRTEGLRQRSRMNPVRA